MRKKNKIKNMLAATLIAAGCFCTITSYAANPNWYQDSNGHWYYYITNNEVAKSRWINDGSAWYYFNNMGVMQTGWVTDGGKTFYLNPSGAMQTGVQTIDGTRYYFNADGSAAVKTITPNAYLTNEKGAIIEGFRVISGVAVQAPQMFVPSNAYPMENWRGILNSVSEVGRRIYNMTGGTRRFRVFQDKIVYCQLRGNTETELITLKKLPENGGWEIKIKTPLNSSVTDSSKGEAYDYQVLRLFCYGFSSTADQLDSIIYDSWSGKNVSGLSRDNSVTAGDFTVYYDAENGAGTYRIYPAGINIVP